MLLFVPPERQEYLRDRLKHFINVPFMFERQGSQIIFYDQEQDFQGIEEERASLPISNSRELLGIQ